MTADQPQPLTLAELLNSVAVKGAIAALSARIVQGVAHRYGIAVTAGDVSGVIVDCVLYGAQMMGAAAVVYGRRRAPVKDAARQPTNNPG